MAINNIAPQAYTDLNGLSGLKLEAQKQSPEALREAARQFESIFTRMMLKTMREASSGDPMFDSQQSGFYRDMFDDQIAVDMSRGHGLGLAEQLVAQMQRAGLVAASGANEAGETPHSPAVTRAEAGGGKELTSQLQSDFVRRMLPAATEAGRQLGVDPQTLIAQAALETGWGTSLPARTDGGSSHNLFGIKAGRNWQGDAAASPTIEFEGGVAARRVERFRAYDNADASVQDYVALLRDNPRYAPALGTGTDAQAFANALQRGGYATDPRYADKLVAVTQKVRDVVDITLKDGKPLPISLMTSPG